jgi:surface-adhesin protein E
MRTPILVLALLLLSGSTFGQTANNEALGGKTSESKSAPPAKKSVPKPASNSDKPLYSACGVYYRNRRDMIGDSNLGDKWFSLGESARKHFWYNPRRTTCDAKTSVLKSWIREDHKNTDSNYALVLYELKCKTDQLRVKTVIEYDKSGNVLETNNHGDDTWQDVAPRTAGEVMLRTLCRRP